MRLTAGFFGLETKWHGPFAEAFSRFSIVAPLIIIHLLHIDNVPSYNTFRVSHVPLCICDDSFIYIYTVIPWLCVVNSNAVLAIASRIVYSRFHLTHMYVLLLIGRLRIFLRFYEILKKKKKKKKYMRICGVEKYRNYSK